MALSKGLLGTFEKPFSTFLQMTFTRPGLTGLCVGVA